jgi:VCBS repeat-containing protein
LTLITSTVSFAETIPVTEAIDDSATVAAEEDSHTIPVLENDTVIDGGLLTITEVTQGALGAVFIDEGGASLSYLPAVATCGPDSFTYTIADGLGGSDSATVAIDISCPDEVAEEPTTTTAPDETTTTAPAEETTTTTAAVEEVTTTTAAVEETTTTTAPVEEATTTMAPPEPELDLSTAATLIIKLVAGLTVDEQAAVVEAHGGVETSAVPVLRLHMVAVDPNTVDETIAAYEADPAVVSVDRDLPRAAEAVPNDPGYSEQWALPLIGWEEVYGVVDPAGSSTIAVLDTGVDASIPDLAGRVVGGWSFDEADPASDASGHGTAVASIAAASVDDGAGIAGVAYDGVSIMPVRVLGDDGTGQDSDIIEGLVWAVDHGADVVVMAFSNPGESAALQFAVDYAWARGVVLVAAAGNDGGTAPTYPAGLAKVVGVGATDSSDAVWSSSNQSNAVFMVAPGVGIAASNGTVTGTSASAAEVAGAAAVMRANDAGASPSVIVGRLARNAEAVDGVVGNGRLHLGRALLDESDVGVTPVGAPGGGGPFVGPYTVAANMGNISVGAQSPDPVIVGNSATYTVNVDMAGNATAVGVLLDINPALPAGVTASFSAGGTCRVSTNADWSSTLTLTTANGAPLGATSFTVRGRAFASTTCAGAPLSGGSGTDTGTATLNVSGGSWAAGDVSIVEGNSGTSIVNIPVTFTRVGTGNVSVNWSIGGGTANGDSACGSSDDYIDPPNGSISNASAGYSNSASFTVNVPVTICGDLSVEANETFNITLSNATGSTISDNTGTVTITNDDLPTVQFIATASAGAENTSPVNLAVVLSASSSQTVTVNYAATGGSATGGGVDYTLLGTGTLTFTPGDTSENVQLSINNDSLDEDDETVIITLSSPVNATLGTNTTHTRTITDNDNPPTVAFTAAASSGTEAVTPVTLAVALSAASGRTVTVNYAVTGGTATGGGVDYTLLGTSTLTFTPGDTSENVQLSIDNDSLDEDDETVIVTLSGPVNAALGSPATHTRTITDDDPAPTVAFTAASSSDSEAVSPVSLAVALSAGSGRTVTVNYAVTGGTATGGGVDYTLLGTGTLTFTSGDTSENVTLNVIDDPNTEPDETVIVTLSSPINATLGAITSHTYTIVDNDNDPPVCDDPQSDSTAEDTLLNGAVVCEDPDGDTLSYTLVDDVDNGVLTFESDGSFTYDPDPNFHGSDSFTFYASDASEDSNTATFSITITPVDDDPVAVDDSATVDEDDPATTIDVLANDTDIDDGPKTIDTVTQPANGTVVITNAGADLSYEPDANYCNDGSPTDDFTYTLNGGSTAMVTITVTCVNDAPVAVDDSDSTDEDTVLSVAAPGVLGNDTDVEGDTLAVVEVEGAALNVGAEVTLVSGATVTLNSDGSFSYDPNGAFESLDDGETDTDSFTYRAGDGDLDSNLATVTITINGVNDAPVLDLIGDKEVDDQTELAFTATAEDVDGDALSFSLEDGATGDVPPGASIDSDTGDFTWTPTEAQGGHDYTFDICVSDGDLDDCETVTVTVNDVTDPQTVITFPANGGAFSEASWDAGCSTTFFGDVCGTASDAGSGLDEVLFTLRRVGGNYWNGTSFSSPTPVEVSAAGTSPWSKAVLFATFPSTGQYVLTAWAIDNAGNHDGTPAVSTFQINRYGLDYLSPIDDSTPTQLLINTGKNGRTVPVKVVVTLEGVPQTSSHLPEGALTIRVTAASCTTWAPDDPVEEYVATDAGNSNGNTNQFRWSGSHWIYNLNTKGLGLITNSCYRLDVYLDGVKISTQRFAIFKPVK